MITAASLAESTTRAKFSYSSKALGHTTPVCGAWKPGATTSRGFSRFAASAATAAPVGQCASGRRPGSETSNAAACATNFSIGTLKLAEMAPACSRMMLAMARLASITCESLAWRPNCPCATPGRAEWTKQSPLAEVVSIVACPANALLGSSWNTGTPCCSLSSFSARRPRCCCCPSTAVPVLLCAPFLPMCALGLPAVCCLPFETRPGARLAGAADEVGLAPVGDRVRFLEPTVSQPPPASSCCLSILAGVRPICAAVPAVFCGFRSAAFCGFRPTAACAAWFATTGDAAFSTTNPGRSAPPRAMLASPARCARAAPAAPAASLAPTVRPTWSGVFQAPRCAAPCPVTPTRAPAGPPLPLVFWFIVRCVWPRGKEFLYEKRLAGPVRGDVGSGARTKKQRSSRKLLRTHVGRILTHKHHLGHNGWHYLTFT